MLSEEQIGVVAAQLRLPAIVVRMAARRPDARGEAYRPADLIAELTARRAAGEPRPLR
ncbi:MAG: hypothetical protein ACRDJO_13650 [Actinomycetota bacterium]